VSQELYTGAFVGLANPDIGDAEVEEVVETLRSGWVIAGPRAATFEGLLADHLAVPHVRCLSSCTAALFLALKCAGIGPGDEVLVPAITFVAGANVIEQAGATPVLVDCEPGTGLIDLDHAASLVGPRTRGVMPVHLGGRPVDIERLNELRDRFGLCAVEDAAHAIGAYWGERAIGAHGNPTAFSFHAAKNMTTIEGGALALEGEAMAGRVRRLAQQGISASGWDRHGTDEAAEYDVIEPGYKLAMTDVAAAIGIHQLARLNESIDRREELSRTYNEAFAGLPLDLEPEVEPGVRHARHLYVVRVTDEAPLTRDELMVRLRRAGIGSSVHFKGLHMLSYYRHRCGVEAGDLPNSTDHARRALSLPLHPRLAASDQERVIDGVVSALEGR
jgi:dTDP-4-amino-4,6-dideoxygalactose transaminase